MTDDVAVRRVPTGINGFDHVALGGLPAGRSTLVTGTTGTGKTLFALEFLAKGVLDSDEPGVFVNFEERPEDVRRNATSLGFPIEQWEREGRWAFVDAAAEVDESVSVVGAYDFGGLVARIERAIREIGAARVSLDSLGAIFSWFPEPAVVRHELHRIADVLSRLGTTSILTAERMREYDGVSRYNVEEFVLDNVIILRNVLTHERRRRTLEVVKFRGTVHRAGEWLFTIDPQDGIVVLPLAFLTTPPAPASQTRVTSGNAGLDQMCGGGPFKDSIILLTGPSGSGKTLSALAFTAAGVTAGEPCLMYSLDESRAQVGRNASGWGLDLDAMEASGLLGIVCDFPEVASLEDHFLLIRRYIEDHQPSRLVIDTLSALERVVSPRALLDFVIALGALVRHHQVTTLLTSAPADRFTPPLAPTIASLVDITVRLNYVESPGEITRAIAVLQTRGSAHEQTIRQVTIDSDGLHIGGRLSSVVGILHDYPSVAGMPWWSGGPPQPEGHHSGE